MWGEKSVLELELVYVCHWNDKRGLVNEASAAAEAPFVIELGLCRRTDDHPCAVATIE